MLRGLWTGASIFTLHSVASLQAAQIFIGATSHLAYWWTLHPVDGNRCVKRGPRHGPQVQYMNCVMALAVKMVRVASRMGYAILLQHVMDTTARCKDFLLFPWRSSVWVIRLSTDIEVTVNVVMGVVQRFVWKFTVRSQRDNKTAAVM